MQPSIDEWVKENLRYDPDTGHLWWIKRGCGKIFDKPVGSLDKYDGYIKVGHKSDSIKKNYVAHRLAWFLYHGVWPKEQVDHINNVRDDNRILNLREATSFENQCNRKPQVGCSSKYKGVSYKKQDCKWQAQIQINYKNIYLGLYHNEEEAALAYNKAALEHFGKYAKINIIEPLDTDMTNTYINSSSGELTC